MAHHRSGERCLFGSVLGHEHGRGQTLSQPAVFLRDLDHEHPELARLLHELDGGLDLGLARFELFVTRKHLFERELRGRVGQHESFLVEVLIREDVFGVGRLEQELAAFSPVVRHRALLCVPVESGVATPWSHHPIRFLVLSKLRPPASCSPT